MNEKYKKKILDFENDIYQSFFENTQEFLTHYTSFKGLDGILKSKSLWFSSVFNMKHSLMVYEWQAVIYRIQHRIYLVCIS